jgi:hypothetical protein
MLSTALTTASAPHFNHRQQQKQQQTFMIYTNAPSAKSPHTNAALHTNTANC